MWKLFDRLRRGGPPRPGSKKDPIGSVFEALQDGEAARPLPTLVCRTCGLKYANTGTYLQGSKCPACQPNP